MLSDVSFTPRLLPAAFLGSLIGLERGSPPAEAALRLMG